MLAQCAGRRRERVQAHPVVVERGRDKLRQAGRVQQARTDAARERLARTGQQRNAGPERVASRRVRSVRKRVERKVGAAQPRDVRFLRRMRSEEKSRRIDACLRGEALQIRLRARARREQPQHGVRHARHHVHPDREHRRRQLVALVEARENERILGQTGVAPRDSRRQRAASVVDEIAARHPPDALVVSSLAALGNDDVVGNDPVDRVVADRPGKAHVVELHGCGARCEDSEPPAARVAFAIDQQVDPVVADDRCRVGVGQASARRATIPRTPRGSAACVALPSSGP